MITSLAERKRLVRRHRSVAIKDRVQSFSHIAGYFQKLPAILNWDQGPPRPILHRKLARLNQRPHALDVALNADIAENHESWLHRQSV